MTRFIPDGRAAAFAVGILALALRLGHLLDFSRLPLFWRPTVDTALYLDTARNIATSVSLPAVFFKPPLFPIVLGGWMRLADGDLLALRLPFACLGALTAVLTWWVARRLFTAPTALLAGLFQATQRSAVFFDGELLEIGLATCLQVAGLAAVLLAARRASRKTAGIAGFLLGLGCVARPTFFLWSCFALLWLGRRRGSAALVGLLLAVLPVTLHNAVRGHDFVVVSSNFGINLYIGNSSWANGRIAATPEFPAEPARARRLATSIAEGDAGHPLRASAVSRYWTRRALRSAADRPLHTLALLGRKLYFAWHGAAISDNEDLSGLTRYLYVIRFLPGMWLLAPLGLVGLCLAGSERSRELRLLRSYVLLQLAALLPFFIVERFRLPWVPALAIFAAWTVAALVHRTMLRRRDATRLAAACVVAFLLCNVPLWGVNAAPVFDLDYKIAYAYQQEGRIDAAIRAYRLAIARNPQAALPRNALGVLLARQGRDLDEAARWIESALHLDPTYEAHFAESLAFVELQRGAPEAALRACSRGLARSPRAPLRASLLWRQGEALMRLGRTDEALRSLREGLGLAEEKSEAARGIQQLLQELGSPAQTEKPGS